MFQITRVDHTAYRTHDMEKTVQFYCGALVLPLLQTMRGSEGGGTAPPVRYWRRRGEPAGLLRRPP